MVKDGLVEKAHHWKGFNTNEALALGKRLIFSYIDRTLRWKTCSEKREVDPGEYTFQVEVKVYPIPSWKKCPVHKRQAMFRRIIRHWENEARRMRVAEGKVQVKGMERISKDSPFSKPQNRRIRTPQPLCHADLPAEYKLYEKEYREIVAAHRIASAYYRSGVVDVEFPSGTFRPRQSEAYEQAA